MTKGSGFALQVHWDRLSERISLCREISRALALIDWDYETYMPPGSAEARAETKSRLSRLLHEMFTSDEVGHLLGLLEEEIKDLPYDAPQAGIIRVTRRRYDRSIKLPSSLVASLSRAESLGYNAWEKARAEANFDHFRPHLERIVELQVEKANALATADDPYDTLLDLFEPGIKSSAVSSLFDRLKSELVPFAQALYDRAEIVDDSILRQPYDVDAQWEFTLAVIQAIGFDLNRGRQDRSLHPFTIGLSPSDVRLTTRIDPTNLASGLYASIHEAGHGLYEQGLPVELADTFLGEAASQSVHESQSRLWENIVGRSKPFWRHFLPIAARYFPAQLKGVDVEDIYRAVNRVHPSPIRVEADEVTYNLHIFLRFELERDLIHGRLQVRELPDAWNEKTRQYLGFTPEMTPKASFKTSTGRRGSLATSRRTPWGRSCRCNCTTRLSKPTLPFPTRWSEAISPPSGGGCARTSTSMARSTRRSNSSKRRPAAGSNPSRSSSTSRPSTPTCTGSPPGSTKPDGSRLLSLVVSTRGSRPVKRTAHVRSLPARDVGCCMVWITARLRSVDDL